MRKTLSLFLAMSLVLSGGYLFFEPGLTGATTHPATDEVLVTQVVDPEITISSPLNATMTPAIAGLTGGTGNASIVWNVKTNDIAGYTLSLRAGTSPALVSGDNNFADYIPATADVPDFAWSIPDAASEFGYTVEGTHTAPLFLNDATNACAIGSLNTVDACWLNTAIVDRNIAFSSAATTALGTDTTVKVRAQVTSGRHQPSGSYTTTLTATAVMN